MFHRLRMYICLDDIYTLSTRYLHDIYIYMFTRYLDYVYTISTLYLHYIYTTSVHIYMSTRCLHDIYSMSTYIYVYTLSTRYLYYVCTYDLHYISTLWYCVSDLRTCLHNWLQCVSAAVPWRAACPNIVCVCDSDLPWCTVCRYFVFFTFTFLVWQIRFFLARCLSL